MKDTAGSSTARQPWTDRLNARKLPKRVRLDKDFAGIKAGTMLFVGTPEIVDAYVRRVPPGQTRTIERLRRELARAHRCEATCPVSTAIFLRVVAQAAIEQIDQGRPLAQVSPFWRVIEPGSVIARKLPLDQAWIAHQRDMERPVNATHISHKEITPCSTT